VALGDTAFVAALGDTLVASLGDAALGDTLGDTLVPSLGDAALDDTLVASLGDIPAALDDELEDDLLNLFGDLLGIFFLYLKKKKIIFYNNFKNIIYIIYQI
jgi:hypothetical protein